MAGLRMRRITLCSQLKSAFGETVCCAACPPASSTRVASNVLLAARLGNTRMDMVETSVR